MSRPGHWWHGNVQRAIREYPELERRGKVDELSRRERDDYEAITRAITRVMRWRGGNEIIRTMELHAWGDRMRYDEVGNVLHVSASTAKGWYRRFVDAAAEEMGYKNVSKKAKDKC